MHTLILIKVFILCLQQVLSFNNAKFFFKLNPCQIHCFTTEKEVKHTSCISTDYKLPPCRVFAYDIKTFSQVNIMGQLVIGHNGLRDRIAEHMHISHMAEMFWSEELEAMAKRYAYTCNPFRDDYCASINSVFREGQKNESNQFSNIEVSFSDQLRNKSPYALIRQTRFCHKSVFFPNNFIHIALSTWYNERYTLQPPERMNISTGLYKQRLRGDNNFTIIADPNVDKFGCSIANVAKQYFCIFCNYFKVKRVQPEMHFYLGPPATDCPSWAPLRDNYYKNLCTIDPRLNKTGKTVMDKTLFLNYFCISYILVLYCY